MSKLHKDILSISFKHRFEIKRAFKEILGINGIEHFSLDLVRPDGEMVFLSSTPSHGYEICRRGYGQYDGIISPDYYQNYEFYWWKDACHKAYANKITEIREKVLGLKHGFMLVRRWNNFFLIYSFATKSADSHFQSMVINNLNTFLKMGDFAYAEMCSTYANYCDQYEPPVIENFYNFEGGRPPARYTKSYKPTSQGLLVPQDEIIPVKSTDLIAIDFKSKIRVK